MYSHGRIRFAIFLLAILLIGITTTTVPFVAQKSVRGATYFDWTQALSTQIGADMQYSSTLTSISAQFQVPTQVPAPQCYQGFDYFIGVMVTASLIYGGVYVSSNAPNAIAGLHVHETTITSGICPVTFELRSAANDISGGVGFGNGAGLEYFVHTGDVIKATITISGSTWSASVSDLTTDSQTFTDTATGLVASYPIHALVTAFNFANSGTSWSCFFWPSQTPKASVYFDSFAYGSPTTVYNVLVNGKYSNQFTSSIVHQTSGVGFNAVSCGEHTSVQPNINGMSLWYGPAFSVAETSGVRFAADFETTTQPYNEIYFSLQGNNVYQAPSAVTNHLSSSSCASSYCWVFFGEDLSDGNGNELLNGLLISYSSNGAGGYNGPYYSAAAQAYVAGSNVLRWQSAQYSVPIQSAIWHLSTSNYLTWTFNMLIYDTGGNQICCSATQTYTFGSPYIFNTAGWMVFGSPLGGNSVPNFGTLYTYTGLTIPNLDNVERSTSYWWNKDPVVGITRQENPCTGNIDTGKYIGTVDFHSSSSGSPLVFGSSCNKNIQYTTTSYTSTSVFTTNSSTSTYTTTSSLVTQTILGGGTLPADAYYGTQIYGNNRHWFANYAYVYVPQTSSAGCINIAASCQIFMGSEVGNLTGGSSIQTYFAVYYNFSNGNWGVPHYSYVGIDYINGNAVGSVVLAAEAGTRVGDYIILLSQIGNFINYTSTGGHLAYNPRLTHAGWYLNYGINLHLHNITMTEVSYLVKTTASMSWPAMSSIFFSNLQPWYTINNVGYGTNAVDIWNTGGYVGTDVGSSVCSSGGSQGSIPFHVADPGYWATHIIAPYTSAPSNVMTVTPIATCI
jgi:hypothetical protein